MQKVLEQFHQLRREECVTRAAQQHEQRKTPEEGQTLRNLLEIAVDVLAVDDEQGGDKPHRYGIHVEAQEVRELVNVGLHAENINSLLEEFFGDALGHGLVRLGARVQVIARIETVAELARVFHAAHRLVEIHAAVEIRCSPEPRVERHADKVAVLVVGAPAVYGQERAAVNFQPELARMRDVERAHPVDEVVCRWHVAPGAEPVHLDTDRVDDVVYAVLHNDGAGAGDVHLDGEAGGALQAVCRIRDAAVFAQNSRAAYRAPDDGDAPEPLAGATKREVVGPVLSRDGIAEAHEREVLLFGKDVDGVEEVNPVRFAREVVGEARRLREVAVAVLAARKRARDGRAGVHLREACKVEAHVKCFACGDVECDFVAQDFFARGDCAGSSAAERDGGRRIFSRRIFRLRAVYRLRGIRLRGGCFAGSGLRDVRLGNRHGLRAGEVRKMEPQLAARKTRANRVAQRQVLRVGRFLAVGDGGGVAPACDPFREILFHKFSFF